MEQPVIRISEILDKDWKIEKKGLLTAIYKTPKGPTLTIPSIIPLTEDLAWGIGFFIAEGNKCSYGIGVSNSDFTLVKNFQEAVHKNFGIENTKWQVHVKTSEKNQNLVKQKWVRRTKNKNVTVNYMPLATKDNVEIRINSTLLAIIFNRFVKRSIELILPNRNLILAFLRGHEVGDGSVIQQKGLLYGTSIAVKEPDIKDILLRAFERLYGIAPRVRKNRNVYEVSCTSIHLMTRFILDKHFYEAEKQWKKLVRCYLKKQYTRSHIRYWSALHNRTLLVEELRHETKRSHWAVRDAMNKDAKLGLIKISKERIPNRPGPYYIFYSLTLKGKELLNIIGGVEL